MATYTSITITYIGNGLWGFTDNTMPSGKYRISNANSAITDDNVITFKTKTGSIIYNKQPYSIFNYVDMTDSGNNFTPTSATQLISQLKTFDFFGSSDGGGSAPIAFTDLTDTFSLLIGREGQMLVVNEDGTLITTREFQVIENSTDLADMPSTIQPNLFLVGNETGDGYIQVDPNLFVRPVLPFAMTRSQKGYHWEENSEGDMVTIVNYEPEDEIGDFFSGCVFKNPLDAREGVIRIKDARWNGGDPANASSFEYNESDKIAFSTDPDTE